MPQHKRKPGKCKDCGGPTSATKVERCRSCAQRIINAQKAVGLAKRRAILVENVEFLVEVHARVDEVPRRVGVTSLAALEKELRRCGRPDLARIFETHRKADRHARGECRDCGGVTWHKNVDLCHKCRNRDLRINGYVPVGKSSTVGDRDVHPLGATA